MSTDIQRGRGSMKRGRDTLAEGMIDAGGPIEGSEEGMGLERPVRGVEER